MFRGSFEHAVDDKGRLAIPTLFRGALAGLHDERLVATRFRLGTRRCLDVYPLSVWQRFEDRLQGKNRFNNKIMRFRNFYVSGAQEMALDGQGRVLLPAHLREYAGLKRDVMITGDVEKFRIWDKRVWEAAFSEDEETVLNDDEFLGSLDV